MAKPQFYDYIRKVRENKLALREFSKENQIAKGVFLSEDLLIRSSKEIQKNILPFLRTIFPTQCDNVIGEMSTFKRYG